MPTEWKGIALEIRESAMLSGDFIMVRKTPREALCVDKSDARRCRDVAWSLIKGNSSALLSATVVHHYPAMRDKFEHGLTVFDDLAADACAATEMERLGWEAYGADRSKGLAENARAQAMAPSMLSRCRRT